MGLLDNNMDPSENNPNAAGDGHQKGDAHELISFKIRSFGDFMEQIENNSFMFSSPSTKISQFLKTVSDKLQIPFEDMDLMYQEKNTGDIYHLSKVAEKTFAELGISPSTSSQYSLTLEKRRRKGRKLCFDIPDDEVIVIEVSDKREPEPEKSEDLNDATDASCALRPVRDFGRKEFVGLKNQSSTCYMNSLLQALFFCPEFRNCLYLHNFKYDPQKKSIGTALQNLFLKLQFSTRWSIETENMTRTFGWRENENTVQHDIEELYRILMELLGDEFKKSHSYSITDSLFGGIMNDFVECLCCGKKNVKKTFFTALHLPVTLFGKPLPEPTLESSLKLYVTPELLSDNNQYLCENCGKLVDAHKGLSFAKLPYFMCILLQRSEFDFNTMLRKKCCDRVSFPEILNMNEFVDNDNSTDDHADKIHPIDIKDIRGELYDLNGRTSHSRPYVNLQNDEKTESNGSGGHLSNKALEAGPNSYQLLSILIHRGKSSLAGHYYAYCLDLETNRWNKFNDSSVSMIHPNEIPKTFGGEGSEQFAYMLIYRRIDNTLNSLPLTMAELPKMIVDLWSFMEEKELESKALEAIENDTIRINVFYRQPGSWEPQSKEVVLGKADSLPTSALKCRKEFGPFTSNPTNVMRLARFNERKGIMDMTFDYCEDISIGSISTLLRGSVMLETISGDIGFGPYTANDVVFKTHFVDTQKDTVMQYQEIHTKVDTTVGELRLQVSRYFTDAPGILGMIVQSSALRDLSGEDETLLLFELEAGACYDLFVEDQKFADSSDLMTFANNHYHSTIFSIVCEIPLHDNSVGTNTPMPMSPGGFSSDGGEFAPMNVADLQNGTKVNDTDESSVDSKMSTSDSNQTLEMPSESDISSDSNLTEMANGDLSSESSPERARHSHYFRVLDEELLEDGRKRYVVKASTGLPLRQLSKELQVRLEINEAQFIMYKMLDEIEEEIVSYNQTVGGLEFDSMIVKLGHRLLKDEGRVRVLLLDLANITESPPVLFVIVLYTTMTVKSVRKIVEETALSVPDIDTSIFNNYRLRKNYLGNPSRIMKDHQMVHEFFPNASGDLYLQPISPEFSENDKSDDRWSCMLLFHWKPNDMALLPPVEIMFKYDYTISLEALLADKISEKLCVPIEDLEVARPEKNFPCILNSIVIQEKLEWFRLDNKSHKHISVHNDEGILFIRNKSESLKTIPPDERRILEEEAMSWRGEYTMPAPRKKIVDKEIGLKINLARSPPT